MENKPSYEELLRLYKAEKDKNTKLEKDLFKKDKKILKLEAKMFDQNILINKLLKKIEDKDIKLKKQLCDRFGIKSDKKEKVVVNEAEELSTRKFKAKKKRGRKEGTQDASCFDVSKVEYKEEVIDIEDKKCLACNSDLVYVNDNIFYKVGIVPAKVQLTKYIVKQYKCSYCSEEVEQPSINCFSNESFLTPSLGAYIVNNKYNYALPLYRQESILSHLGAPISRMQLSNYAIAVAEKLEPIYNLLKKELLSTSVKVLHADETTLKVIHKTDNKRDKSYVWLYASSLYENPIYVYEYKSSREGKNPQEFLKEYDGYLVCDDYKGYNSVENVTLSKCWFHAKKKYADLIKTIPLKQRNKSKAVELHNMISDIIYQNNLIEEKTKNPQKIKEERNKIVAPLVNEYFSKIKDLYNNGVDKSSELGKAINYSIKIEEGLRTFLEDGHIPMTNNLAERGIKPFVILRKNSLFSNTENEAEASCILMSIVQTAKMNLLKPDKYIEYVLERIDDTSTSLLNTLLPTNKDLPQELKYKKEDAE